MSAPMIGALAVRTLPSVIGVLTLAIVLSVSAAAPEKVAREADAALNAVYDDLTSTLGGDEAKAIRDVQLAWIRVRDRTCAFESSLERGDPDEKARCLARLTQIQTAQLDSYLQFKRRNRLSVVPPSSVSGPQDCLPLSLPAVFTVQAIRVGSGSIETDVQLGRGENDTRTGAVDVVVNRPGENVVLVLVGRAPVVWNIQRTAQTNVAAVIAGGDEDQAVVGIDRTTPLVIATKDGRRDCSDYVPVGVGTPAEPTNRLLERLTGHSIEQQLNNPEGQPIYVGAPPAPGIELVRSDVYRPEDFATLPRFPSGKKAIDLLIEQGRLRRATPAELDAWMEKAHQRFKYSRNQNITRPYGVNGEYVVLGEMRFPVGVQPTGSSVAYLIPKGVPLPAGSALGRNVYFMESGDCMGPYCPSGR